MVPHRSWAPPAPDGFQISCQRGQGTRDHERSHQISLQANIVANVSNSYFWPDQRCPDFGNGWIHPKASYTKKIPNLSTTSETFFFFFLWMYLIFESFVFLASVMFHSNELQYHFFYEKLILYILLVLNLCPKNFLGCTLTLVLWINDH